MRSFGKNIILVRHGETEFNVSQIMMGQSDSPLTEKGVKQAHDAANRLKSAGIKVIISSDLGRAVKTAEIISSTVDVPILRFDPIFRERTFGDYDLKPRSYLEEKFPQNMVDGIYVFENDFPSAEPIKEFYDRVINGIRKVAEEFKGEKVLIVTHRGILHMAYAYIHEVPLNMIRKFYAPDNCTIENY